jgi:peroxiredoxin
MRARSFLASAAVVGAALSILPFAGAAQAPTLGPVDGHDLPAIDLERVTVGSMAPDFTLAQYRADTFTLSDLRGSKNVVLVFYRGSWCPYCMNQLTELRSVLDDELKVDTELVVLSIDGDAENAQAFARISRDDGVEPDYAFLSDPESTVIARYGVLNPDGGRRGLIPHAPAYVIDKEGIVQWLDVQTDYTIRPSNEQLQEALRALGGS